MQSLIWHKRPDGLRSPALICAFSGWNDAGEAATNAVEFLVEQLPAERFAEIDPDEFIDFRSSRPFVRKSEFARVIEWPRYDFYALRAPRAARDLVLMVGPEPDLHWRGFCEVLVELAEALGIDRVVLLGALLADVAHTLPVPLVGLASDSGLLDRVDLNESDYEGPTGIVGVLFSAFCEQTQIPVASLWGAVPHYVAAVSSPKTTLALIRKLERIVGVTVNAAELEKATANYEQHIGEAVKADDEMSKYVAQLEASDTSHPFGSKDNVPTGEALAQDFQRFLKQSSSDC